MPQKTPTNSRVSGPSLTQKAVEQQSTSYGDADIASDYHENFQADIAGIDATIPLQNFLPPTSWPGHQFSPYPGNLDCHLEADIIEHVPGIYLNSSHGRSRVSNLVSSVTQLEPPLSAGRPRNTVLPQSISLTRSAYLDGQQNRPRRTHSASGEGPGEAFYLATDSGYGSLPQDAPSTNGLLGPRQETTLEIHPPYTRPSKGTDSDTQSMQSEVDNALGDNEGSPKASSAFKPRKCDGCPVNITTASQLRKHRNRHGKPHPCHVRRCPRSYPGEGFATSNDRDRHHFTKHKDLYSAPKYWKCFSPGCSKETKKWDRYDNFKTHLEKLHAGVKNKEEKDDPEKKNIVEALLKQSEEWWTRRPAAPGDGPGTGPHLPFHQPFLSPTPQYPFGRQGIRSQQAPSHANSVDLPAGTPNFDLNIQQFAPSQDLNTISAELGQDSSRPFPETPQSRAYLNRARQACNYPPPPFAAIPGSPSLQFTYPASYEFPSGSYEHATNPGSASQPVNSHQDARRRPRPLQREDDVTGPRNQSYLDSFASYNVTSVDYGNLEMFERDLPKARSAPHLKGAEFADLVSNMENSFPPTDYDLASALNHVGGAPGLNDKAPLPSRMVHSLQNPGSSAEHEDTHISSTGSGDVLKSLESAMKSTEPSQRQELLESVKSLFEQYSGTTSSQHPTPPSQQRESTDPLKTRHDKTNKEIWHCQWNGCNKPKSPAEFKKHVRRHTKPYACTFVEAGCPGRFGSKNDLKRHEVTQHVPWEGWRCGETLKNKGSTCNRSFDELDDFLKHLAKTHRYDQSRCKLLSRDCHISRKHEGRYWCGFCRAIKKLAKKGVDGENERFSHICDHLIREDKSIDDWLPIDGHKTKGELGQHETDDKPDDEDTSHSDASNDDGDEDDSKINDESDEVSPPQAQIDSPADPVSPMHAERKRRRSPTSSDDSVEADRPGHLSGAKLRTSRIHKKHKRSKRATHAACCQCESDGTFPARLKLSRACLSCNHLFCSNCRYSTGEEFSEFSE